MAGTRIWDQGSPEVSYLSKILVEIDDRLLAAAAEQLGTVGPRDTIEAALLGAVTLVPSGQPGELISPDEDAADIADADVAMQDPGESTTLDQVETELRQL
jgi:hypothetical protein